MESRKVDKNTIIKIIVCLSVFIIGIIIVRINSYQTNKKSNELQEEKSTIEDKIKNMNDLYYSSKVYLTLDDDAITLNYEKINDIEVGTKKYHKVITEYTKYNGNYYAFNNGVFTPIYNFTDFDYDKTFIELKNIKKLLDLGEITNYKKSYEEYYKVRKIDLKDALKIYNKYNNKEVMLYTEGYIYLTIYYNEENNTLNYIELDLTDLHNVTNKTNEEKVLYKITLKEEKEEDNSFIKDKLNKQ